MTTPAARALHLLFNHPWRVMHGSVLAVMVWLALVLAWPTDTFGRSSAYDVMGSVMPEEGWSLLLLVCSAMQAVALGINRRVWRLISSMVACGVLLLIAGCFAVGAWGGTASGTYGIFAAQAFVVAMREAWVWGQE